MLVKKLKEKGAQKGLKGCDLEWSLKLHRLSKVKHFLDYYLALRLIA